MKEDTLKVSLNSGGTPLVTLSGANVSKLEHRWVIVEYGLNENGDYIWHFSQHRRERPFPQNLDLFYRIIATHLNKVIPSDVTVRIYPPPSDWEIKVISIVAKEIGKRWNFDEEDMSKHLIPICDHMSDEIEKRNPKKSKL